MARRDDNVILVVRQTFHASAEFLFDAWTRPELVLSHTGLREEQDRSEHQHGWEGCWASLMRLVETHARFEKGRS